MAEPADGCPTRVGSFWQQLSANSVDVFVEPGCIAGMSFDPNLVSAVTFDSYSTLVDIDTVETALTAHDAVGDPTSISRIWREQSIQYTLVATQIDAYESF